MLIIPLKPLPNQTVFVTLSNQQMKLNVYQKRTGLFMDILFANGPPVLYGVLCKNQQFLVMNVYLGFCGDFMWVDQSNTNQNPVYTGLGDGQFVYPRFVLVYLAPADILPTALYAGPESAELIPPPV